MIGKAVKYSKNEIFQNLGRPNTTFSQSAVPNFGPFHLHYFTALPIIGTVCSIFQYILLEKIKKIRIFYKKNIKKSVYFIGKIKKIRKKGSTLRKCSTLRKWSTLRCSTLGTCTVHCRCPLIVKI